MKIYGVEVPDDILPEGFIQDVKSTMFADTWQHLLNESTSAVKFMLRQWWEDRPKPYDPLSDSKLMAELRRAYQGIPECAVKLEYVRDVASELGLTVRQVETILGSQVVQVGANDMPAVKGIR